MRVQESWDIPEPLATLRVSGVGGAPIIVRRHGNPDGPRLVLSHGNGLAVDMYYPFWRLLCDEFDLVIYDIRNHGWNPVSELRMHNVEVFIRDNERVVGAIIRHFGNKPTVGVFHSLSALVALLQEAKTPIFSALVLLDPPVIRPNVSERELESAAIRMAAGTRIREVRFDSRDQFRELLDYVSFYRRLVSGITTLASKTLLRLEPSGTGYELCCPREYEAQVLDYITVWSVVVDFEKIHCPTKVIGADPTVDYSYLPSMDLTELIQVSYDFVPDTCHMVQLERPNKCVSMMKEFLAQIGILST